MSHLTRH